MASEPANSVSTPPVSSDRLWAEQLAIGLGILIALLVFMACFHAQSLSEGGKIFGPNYLEAYGWASAIGIFFHLVIHEAGTFFVAWRMKLPLKFRLFPFGANATAILENLPRHAWTDAVVGLAGPVIGTATSMALALVYHFTDNPFFLGMACVGYFYNLVTLIPILDLEGGWIAATIAPQAWLFGLVGCGLVLSHSFNLVLLCVVAFGLPRFVFLIRARVARTDLVCTVRQRVLINLSYFALVLVLAWLGSSIFEELFRLVPEAMGD